MKTFISTYRKLALILLIPAAILFSSFDTVVGPLVNFDKITHDFGTFKQGQVVETTFTFKNTGDRDLVITQVEVPCGCTIPNYTADPIAAGETGEIKVRFNSLERPGEFRKTVKVNTNCGRPDEVPLLMIKGYAEPMR